MKKNALDELWDKTLHRGMGFGIGLEACGLLLTVISKARSSLSDPNNTNTVDYMRGFFAVKNIGDALSYITFVLLPLSCLCLCCCDAADFLPSADKRERADSAISAAGNDNSSSSFFPPSDDRTRDRLIDGDRDTDTEINRNAPRFGSRG